MSAPSANSAPSPGPLLAGGRVILVAQALRFLVRLASAMLLTRLLTPEAYGLQGMALTVYGLLYMIRDFGVLTAAQQRDFTRQAFNAYVRLGLAGGLGLALLGAAVGWPLGWFFHEPVRLPPVLAAMSGAFLFSGAAAPALGLLYREQKIPTLAAIEVGAMTVASFGAVLAALAGLGVWALVLMALINEAAICAAAWVCCPWRPGRDLGGARWGQMLKFGAHLTGFGVTDYYARNLDQIAVGWSTGAAALGLYGRGAQLATLPVQFGIAPFTGWIVASLGQLADQPRAFVDFFRRTLNGLFHVSLPAAVICAVAPEAVIHLLYGRKWLAAAPVLRWLALLLAVQPWLLAPVWLLQSTGRVRRLFALSTTGMLLVGAACLLCVRLGYVAVAAGCATAGAVQAILGLWVCRQATVATMGDLLQPARRPLLLHGGLLLLLEAEVVADGHWLAGTWRLPALLATAAGYYTLLYLTSGRTRAEVHGHFLWAK